MNKILYTLLVLAFFSSCDGDFEETFDKSATERKAEAKSEVANWLGSSAHGWKTVLLVGDKIKAGGYFLFDFEQGADDNGKLLNSGVVSIATGFDNDETPGMDKFASEFIVGLEDGVVLNFNTYNEAFYWLIDPNFWEPKGIGADLEYVFVKKEGDNLIFRGKINDIELVLEPATAEDWTSTAIQDIFDNFRINFTENFTGLSITEGMGGTEKAPFIAYFQDAFITNEVGYSDKKEFFYLLNYWTEGEILVQEYAEAAYIFTPEGVILSNPFVMAGDTVSKLTYNQDQDTWGVADEGVKGELVSSGLPLFSHPGATDSLFEFLEFEPTGLWLTYWNETKMDDIISPLYWGPVIAWANICAQYTTPDGVVHGPGILLQGESWGDYAYVPMDVVKDGESKFKLVRNGKPIVTNIEGVEDFIATDENVKNVMDVLFNETGWSIHLAVYSINGLDYYDYYLYNMEDPGYSFERVYV